MALAQTRPISIPAASSSSSAPLRSHFRRESDASDLSINIPAASSFPFTASHDPFAAFQLSQRLACFSAEDVLSCSSSARSRLVVLPETISIESAGERLAEADDAETWVVLKRTNDEANTSASPSKLRKSDCAGLLGLEDLSAFFAAVFGPHPSTSAVVHSNGGPHNLVSPPASPKAGASRSSLSEHEGSQAEIIRARVDAKKPVAASLVSNLSGKTTRRERALLLQERTSSAEKHASLWLSWNAANGS